MHRATQFFKKFLFINPNRFFHQKVCSKQINAINRISKTCQYSPAVRLLQVQKESVSRLFFKFSEVSSLYVHYTHIGPYAHLPSFSNHLLLYYPIYGLRQEG